MTFTARDVLTYMFSECKSWAEDVDGDADDEGRQIVYVNHDIRISDHLLSELLDMADIKPARYDETAMERLRRALDEDIERDNAERTTEQLAHDGQL